MEGYLQEKAELAAHILQGEWDAAHEKAFALLQREPENIEFIVFFTVSSSYGGFFQDAVNYGKKVLLWAENNGSDITDFNALGMSVIDIQQLIAQAYFGLKDYTAAANELDKIRKTQGQLPDTIKLFAVKNENMINGADAALRLAEQLDSAFSDRESDDYMQFKYFESQICIHEIDLITNGSSVCSNLPIAQAQKAAKYILRMVSCFEGFQESQLNEDRKNVFMLAIQWLSEIALTLYTGGDTAHPEMEINSRYSAAQECIMTLEKLSDFGKGFAQYLLGNIYAGAFNVAQNNVRAFQYYKSAYENGENAALVNLAFYYYEGAVVEKNTQIALEYAKKAADGGSQKAYGLLGKIYIDSMGDVEQGLIWLNKACANGDETAKNTILRLAGENIDHLDEKLRFLSEINERTERDIDSLDSQLELGKKYVQYYMEIEKYYIAPLERVRFLAFCADAQPETLLKHGGFVPVNFFENQLEKYLQEEKDSERKIQLIRTIAKRADSLIMWEMIPIMAKGSADLFDLGWDTVCKYIYNRREEWGWNGYMEDGEQWHYIKQQSNMANQASPQQRLQNETPVNTNTSGSSDAYNHSGSGSSGGCYVATAVYGSYDCPEVWVLRRFRDSMLMKTWYGRIFVQAYYRISPFLVDRFGNMLWFQRFWKGKLDRLIVYLQMKGLEDSPYEDASLAATSVSNGKSAKGGE